METDAFRLDDKVAIISAASDGIGAGIAKQFAAAGAKVVIGARSQSKLDGVVAAIENAGGSAIAVAGDLAKRAGMEHLVEAAAEEYGKINIVVNNAGGTAPGSFMDTTEAAFNAAFAWNVTTAFNLTQLSVPYLLKDGGSVINIASAAGSFASRGFSTYGTAKAALAKLTRHLAADLSPRVRVNAIAPGSIRTAALDSILDESLEKLMADATPLRKIGEVKDIAHAALYLASPASAYVTGHILDVNGGIQASNFEMGLPDLEF